MENKPTSGILTFAFGLQYQKMAYCQALTARKVLGLTTTVVIHESHATSLKFLEKLSAVANVVTIKSASDSFQYEAFAYEKSPYDITFKTDADVLFPLGCHLYHNQSLPCTSGVACDILGAVNDTVAYRAVESGLGLPTIYSACFSFDKHRPQAKEFYQEVYELFGKWYSLKLWNRTEKMLPPTTDSIYSLAWAKVFGLSRVDGNQFVHAKPLINAWSDPEWTRSMGFMVDDECRMFIEGVRITKPFHYYDKNLITDTFIERLEDVCAIREDEPVAIGRRKHPKAR
jgi:hypothetical protein